MKISSLIIGKGKGSAGNITVVQLKGQSILKQKAEIVANPRTAKQMLQRAMINRAVFAWQLLGGVIKSGWTSLLPYCSEYNTYVSANASHFVNKTFTKENFVMSDVLGSLATKGSLGSLSNASLSFLNGQAEVELDFSGYSGDIKIGDKIKIVAGVQTAPEAGYAEYTITQSDVTAQILNTVLELGDSVTGTNTVYALWLETADGKKSTTSQFVLKS